MNERFKVRLIGIYTFFNFISVANLLIIMRIIHITYLVDMFYATCKFQVHSIIYMRLY